MSRDTRLDGISFQDLRVGLHAALVVVGLSGSGIWVRQVVATTSHRATFINYFLELEIIESWRFARVTHVLRFLYSPRDLPDLFPYFTHRLSLFLWKIRYL